MQPRKCLQVLTASLVVAALLSLPAVASATPQWLSNGRLVGSGGLAGIEKQGVVQFGTLALQSKVFGEFKCKIIAGAPVWNASEKGLNAVEGWEPYLCNSAPINGKGGCVGQSVVTTEEGVGLIVEGTSEKPVYKPLRGKRTLPWTGELFETTEKTTSLNVHKIKIYLDCPAEGLEVPYEGNLEPKVINGVKNGMSPSKLVFEGEGGKTSYLVTCVLHGCLEDPESRLFVSGELTMLGTSQQLITAR
jgi:hypothetical protein